MPTIKFKIIRQGAPIVNIDHFWFAKTGRGIMAIEMDMHSKYCEIGATFGSDNRIGFCINANEHSLYLKDDIERDISTDIEIEGLDSKQWDIFTIECSRYIVRMVLIRQTPL